MREAWLGCVGSGSVGRRISLDLISLDLMGWLTSSAVWRVMTTLVRRDCSFWCLSTLRSLMDSLYSVEVTLRKARALVSTMY